MGVEHARLHEAKHGVFLRIWAELLLTLLLPICIEVIIVLVVVIVGEDRLALLICLIHKLLTRIGISKPIIIHDEIIFLAPTTHYIIVRLIVYNIKHALVFVLLIHRIKA